LETICLEKSRLRPNNSVVPRIKLPEYGTTSWGKIIIDVLSNYGISTQEGKMRFLESSQYKENAVMTGNDRAERNLASYRNYHGGCDGEELAMIRQGVTDASNTTYVSTGISSEQMGYNKSTPAILVYSPDALERIGPLSFPNSNGFSVFHFGGEIKRRSLLAIFEQ